MNFTQCQSGFRCLMRIHHQKDNENKPRGAEGGMALPPSTWNSLPAHIRSIDTLSIFERHLKFHIFQSTFTV